MFSAPQSNINLLIARRAERCVFVATAVVVVRVGCVLPARGGLALGRKAHVIIMAFVIIVAIVGEGAKARVLARASAPGH